jgi:hypothetical protein
VKISGDGARMTRTSNYILMSFGILQSLDDIMSPKGKSYNCGSVRKVGL